MFNNNFCANYQDPRRHAGSCIYKYHIVATIRWNKHCEYGSVHNFHDMWISSQVSKIFSTNYESFDTHTLYINMVGLNNWKFNFIPFFPFCLHYKWHVLFVLWKKNTVLCYIKNNCFRFALQMNRIFGLKNWRKMAIITITR